MIEGGGTRGEAGVGGMEEGSGASRDSRSFAPSMRSFSGLKKRKVRGLVVGLAEGGEGGRKEEREIRKKVDTEREGRGGGFERVKEGERGGGGGLPLLAFGTRLMRASEAECAQKRRAAEGGQSKCQAGIAGGRGRHRIALQRGRREGRAGGGEGRRGRGMR